ncbi:hypothetical protein DPMN_010066 [Dreissena polymorpha]|uniref:Uncharacterized protein n=1 Tax=Dreissena polymorpha TaxID=45954 RepID=A0A9D4S0L9_DREPO|nr:hypothetical protein DPMN_010066 [Dreissena polymorpha]
MWRCSSWSFTSLYCRVLTRFNYRHYIIMKNAPPPGGHVFQPTGIIFELFQDDIIRMNLLTKFHDDRTINVPYMEKCPAPWQPSFSSKHNIFKLIQDIIKTNLLTKFHEDWTINVASRVLTRKNALPLLLTKFHEDRKINVTSRVLTRKHDPPPDIIRMNLLNKFHEDRTINVASRVLTRKTGPAPWQPCYLSKHIIATNPLTKVHEDWAINVARVLTRLQITVASRVLTRQMLTPHDAQRTTDDGQKAITKAHHQHIVLK